RPPLRCVPSLLLRPAGTWLFGSSSYIASSLSDVLATVVGNSIASAMIEPNNPPSTAEPRFWTVYENVTPPMVRAGRARREPAAKAWFVAIPDLRELGATIPAMNNSDHHLAKELQDRKSPLYLPVVTSIFRLDGWMVL